MNSVIKLIWFFFVVGITGLSWMLMTFMCLGELPHWINSSDQLFTHALVLPAVLFIGASHIQWMHTVSWLD